MLSRASRIARMASRWSGRKSEKPQTRWRISRRPRSADCSAPGVSLLDVIIDQTLEGCRQLVVRAAQCGHVLAVDVDGTVRRFAGARQADADVGRLRFAGAVDDAAHDRARHRLDAL